MAANNAAILALNDIDIADVQTALDNQGYTAARAPNLDNLDVAVSTRNSVVPMAAATSQTEHDATQAAIAGLNDIDQADVQAALTAQGYTVARAGNLDFLDLAISAIPTALENADALLNRDLSAVTVTNTRSPINGLRFLRNRWEVVATTLTVYEEDDTTVAWTAALTVDPLADPITQSDPA